MARTNYSDVTFKLSEHAPNPATRTPHTWWMMITPEASWHPPLGNGYFGLHFKPNTPQADIEKLEKQLNRIVDGFSFTE
ncbi:MAG TPA: hypothetical protein VLK84_09415 [Longimicrobium sp.]|nr:hypothetical protein [Longimicrobium sp.]